MNASKRVAKMRMIVNETTPLRKKKKAQKWTFANMTNGDIRSLFRDVVGIVSNKGRKHKGAFIHKKEEEHA